MSSNVDYVRCMKCQRIIKCSPSDTDAMLKHIKRRHAEILAEEPTDNANQEPKEEPHRASKKVPKKMPKKIPGREPKRSQSDDKVQNLHKIAKEHGISEERLDQIGKVTGLSKSEMADEAERYLSAQKSSSSKTNSNKLNKADSKEIYRRECYRRSMHHWMPPDGRIYCPNCYAYKPPTIQSRSQLNGCCFSWFFSCWPFCCFPCFFPEDNREYLHCLRCKHFLGIYYRENRCVKLNRLYSEMPPAPERPINGVKAKW